MAHFAKLNQNNIVEQVIVISNVEVTNQITFEEEENLGIDFCKKLYGEDTKWVQTSYNNNKRYNYASIGYKYDEIADAFIPPKPYDSWILNTQTYTWDSPTPFPTDNKKCYYWDEDQMNWIVRQI